MLEDGGPVRELLREVTDPYVSAGFMRVTEDEAPTTVPGDRRFTVQPVAGRGCEVVVFALPDEPRYLFSGEGPGWEFWQREDDLRLLRDMLHASIEGRYRWWTEYEQFRYLLRPWKTGRRRVTVSEWSVPGEPVTLRHYQPEPWLPAEGRAAPYPTPTDE